MRRPGRIPEAELHAIRTKVREYLRMRARPDDIQKQLGLSRSAFYRHTQAIRQEDQKWLDEMAANSFVSSYRNALDTIDDQIRELEVIRSQAQQPRDKIEATKAIKEMTIDSIDLLAEGPTVWALKRRGESGTSEKEKSRGYQSLRNE